MNANVATGRRLRLYTKFVAASTLFLIFAGAMVTSTDSGLAVPDWPLSYGMLMPPMVGGIFYEHGHRMIASAVGLLTVILAFALQRREPKRFVRILGWSALGAVVAQGLLGGLTVLLLLPPAVSVAHAGLAELFFALTVAIAFYTSVLYYRTETMTSATDQSLFSKLLLGATYIQILLGAVMRHLGAGLAIPDFPLSFGRLVPPFSSTAVAVAYSHRAWAMVVLALALWGAAGAFKSGVAVVKRTYTFLLLVLGVQILLGGMTVWMAKQPKITSLHVVTGALFFATTVVFALVSHRVRPRSEEERTAAGLREVTA